MGLREVVGTVRVGSTVCIVTPGAIGSNPRVVKEADALHDAGFHVTVIATRTLDCVEPRDTALMRRIKWRLVRLDLRARLVWRTRRLAQLTARAGYKATGLRVFAARGFSPFTRVLTEATLRTPAELYIAHYPAALPAAAEAARRHRGRFAYDAEDFHLGDWPNDPAFAADRRLVRAIESEHLPGCAYVTAASPAIADAYVEAYRIARPSVALNVFPFEQGPGDATLRGTVEPGPSVYWFSQTIGADRGLECAVRAIGLARTRPHLYLRGSPAAGWLERLSALSAEVGAADRLHILAPAAPDDMERLAAAYDLGLAAETARTAARRACLTNKLFTFLAAGIPPLLSATAAQAAFASEADLGDLLYPVDDAAALAQLIDRILGSPEELKAVRTKALGLARARYNWEREQNVILSLARSVKL